MIAKSASSKRSYWSLIKGFISSAAESGIDYLHHQSMDLNFHLGKFAKQHFLEPAIFAWDMLNGTSNLVGVGETKGSALRNGERLKELGQLGKVLSYGSAEQKGMLAGAFLAGIMEPGVKVKLPGVRGVPNKATIQSGHGSSIKMDGHKIYDPNFSPLSSNPRERYRFSDPNFRPTGGDVYFGENIRTAFYEVRQNTNGKSLFVGDIEIGNMLDLTNPKIIKNMNIDVNKLTAKVENSHLEKSIYNYTNEISNQAYTKGYNGIIYSSSRSAGNNTAVVLFGGRYNSNMINEILNMSFKR